MALSQTEGRAPEGAGNTVIERPPPGIARGRFPAPAWTVALLGAAIVFAGLGFVAWKLLRRARR